MGVAALGAERHPIIDKPNRSRLDLKNKQETSINQNALAIIFALIVTPFTFAGPATAASSEFCAHCHGTDGNSSSGAYPSLAGQTKQYLYKQLRDYRDGARTNDNGVMAPAVKKLTDDQIEALAHYLSSL